MSGPSWGASIFMVIAPGRTLLDTDTLTLWYKQKLENSLLSLKLTRKMRFTQQAVVCTALSIVFEEYPRRRLRRSRRSCAQRTSSRRKDVIWQVAVYRTSFVVMASEIFEWGAVFSCPFIKFKQVFTGVDVPYNFSDILVVPIFLLLPLYQRYPKIDAEWAYNKLCCLFFAWSQLWHLPILKVVLNSRV